MSWHQENAKRRAYKLRNKKAHICADDYIQSGKMLCGKSNPLVTVLAKHALKPENNTCKKCLAKLLEDKHIEMRTIGVCFADSRFNYVTSINGTRETICDYYRNTRLNVGAWPSENMQTAIAIEFVELGLKVTL